MSESIVEINMLEPVERNESGNMLCCVDETGGIVVDDVALWNAVTRPLPTKARAEETSDVKRKMEKAILDMLN